MGYGCVYGVMFSKGCDDSFRLDTFVSFVHDCTIVRLDGLVRAERGMV
jgi:hypothetical protein